jgi:hypothetical protein
MDACPARLDGQMTRQMNGIASSILRLPKSCGYGAQEFISADAESGTSTKHRRYSGKTVPVRKADPKRSAFSLWTAQRDTTSSTARQNAIHSRE